MRRITGYAYLLMTALCGCQVEQKRAALTVDEKNAIEASVQKEIDTMIGAVTTKDIETYMRKMPEDFVIYSEDGDVITRAQQRAYALRDWSIIDRTLKNEMSIDSIQFMERDSIFVFTSQRWERIMFRRDGVTTDTVVTTQRHKELWKKRPAGWIGYDVQELGGEIYINGTKYDPR